MIQLHLPRHTSPGNPISGSVSTQNQIVSCRVVSCHVSLIAKHPIGIYVLAGIFLLSFERGTEYAARYRHTEASGWHLPCIRHYLIDAAKTDGQFERDLGLSEESRTLGRSS